jgi:hypothetical protein
VVVGQKGTENSKTKKSHKKEQVAVIKPFPDVHQFPVKKGKQQPGHEYG